MKNRNKLLLLAGVGAIIGYRAFRGKGVFNKVRFPKQRQAILSYRDTHFPGAEIGEVFPYKEGWACSVTYNNSHFFLYIIPSNESGYIFTQTEM